MPRAGAAATTAVFRPWMRWARQPRCLSLPLSGFFTRDSRMCQSCNHYKSLHYMTLYIYMIVIVRANTSICPRLSAAIFVCAENVVKIGVFFSTMANFMLYIGTHSIGTCAGLLHIHIIIITTIIIIITSSSSSNPYLVEDLQWM